MIVDDHAKVRAAIRSVVHAAGLEVIAEAADAEAALAAADACTPDLVLLDIRLPGLDGIEVAERLAGVESPPRVILMSSGTEASFAERLARAPVHGFIRKERLDRRALADLLR